MFSIIHNYSSTYGKAFLGYYSAAVFCSLSDISKEACILKEDTLISSIQMVVEFHSVAGAI